MDEEITTQMELAIAIGKEYKKVFSNSFVSISKGSFGGACVTCYLGIPETWANKISHNDQMRHTYWIHSPLDMDGKFSVECDGIRLNVNPKEEYLAMSGLKFSFRKKRNVAEKIIPQMYKHFCKLYDFVVENVDNIYHVEELDKAEILYSEPR